MRVVISFNKKDEFGKGLLIFMPKMVHLSVGFINITTVKPGYVKHSGETEIGSI